MSEPAFAFGTMALFLFFTAIVVSGIEAGTCRQCEHCHDLRRREQQAREALRLELDQRYRTRLQQPDGFARRHAELRDGPETMTRRSDQGDQPGP